MGRASQTRGSLAGHWPGITSPVFIAGVAIIGIGFHLLLRFGLKTSSPVSIAPLLVAIIAGLPLIFELIRNVLKREFGADLLAGISIITSVILGQYLAGAIVVLMLAGGKALEGWAVQNASSVLRALANRMPSVAHRKAGPDFRDIPIDRVEIGDALVVLPHEICPVDGEVIEGHGIMDESFLTGEPFRMTKAPGTPVISGAINGESALTIRAAKRAIDSRYAKIVEVIKSAEQNRPHMQRLGDQLGAFYTPVAVLLAGAAWFLSGEPIRFLAVLVVATPCPLLIAIPVAIVGSISLAARRSIIIRNPTVLEQATRCRTIIFDKTGTLTYGKPQVTEIIPAAGYERNEILALAASLEIYSKHPLATAIVNAATREGVPTRSVEHVTEPPGQGLRGSVCGRVVAIVGRKSLSTAMGADKLPSSTGGLECFLVVDGRYAATFRFRDAPRSEGVSFIRHLQPKHKFERMLIVSGDRESEVRYLAEQVGVSEVYAQQSPEEKLAIVRKLTVMNKTIYVGDGINDAAAMLGSTIGIAIGQNSDVTAQAAGVVIMEGALKRVDEFLHISSRMRKIALQSAIGGMALSIIGMAFAALGHLPPVAGALTQEAIDVLVIVNALRAAMPPKTISDF
jgi:heavy metal translocating P-type ATPase